MTREKTINGRVRPRDIRGSKGRDKIKDREFNIYLYGQCVCVRIKERWDNVIRSRLNDI